MGAVTALARRPAGSGARGDRGPAGAAPGCSPPRPCSSCSRSPATRCCTGSGSRCSATTCASPASAGSSGWATTRPCCPRRSSGPTSAATAVITVDRGRPGAGRRARHRAGPAPRAGRPARRSTPRCCCRTGSSRWWPRSPGSTWPRPDLSFLTDRAWLGERWSSFAVVIATEVWKAHPVRRAAAAGRAGRGARGADGDAPGWTGPAGGSGSSGCCCRRSGRCCWSCCSTGRWTRCGSSTPSSSRPTARTAPRPLSLLAYDQLAGRLNLGLGSAVSVLLFLLAAAIAVGFVWVFRADLRELSQGGGR